MSDIYTKKCRNSNNEMWEKISNFHQTIMLKKTKFAFFTKKLENKTKFNSLCSNLWPLFYYCLICIQSENKCIEFHMYSVNYSVLFFPINREKGHFDENLMNSFSIVVKIGVKILFNRLFKMYRMSLASFLRILFGCKFRSLWFWLPFLKVL